MGKEQNATWEGLFRESMDEVGLAYLPDQHKLGLFEAALAKFAAKACARSETEEYVAWCRYVQGPSATTIVLCDSDSPGAFKVYRSAVSAIRPSIEAVLEQCAGICEHRASEWDSSVREGSEQRAYEETVLLEVAARIRSLKGAL